MAKENTRWEHELKWQTVGEIRSMYTPILKTIGKLEEKGIHKDQVAEYAGYSRTQIERILKGLQMYADAGYEILGRKGAKIVGADNKLFDEGNPPAGLPFSYVTPTKLSRGEGLQSSYTKDPSTGEWVKRESLRRAETSPPSGFESQEAQFPRLGAQRPTQRWTEEQREAATLAAETQRAQRQAPSDIDQWAGGQMTREEAIREAERTGGRASWSSDKGWYVIGAREGDSWYGGTKELTTRDLKAPTWYTGLEERGIDPYAGGYGSPLDTTPREPTPGGPIPMPIVPSGEEKEKELSLWDQFLNKLKFWEDEGGDKPAVPASMVIIPGKLIRKPDGSFCDFDLNPVHPQTAEEMYGDYQRKRQPEVEPGLSDWEKQQYEKEQTRKDKQYELDRRRVELDEQESAWRRQQAGQLTPYQDEQLRMAREQLQWEQEKYYAPPPMSEYQEESLRLTELQMQTESELGERRIQLDEQEFKWRQEQAGILSPWQEEQLKLARDELDKEWEQTLWERGMTQEQFGLEKQRFGLEERGFGLEEQRFGLQEERFAWEQEESRLEREQEQKNYLAELAAHPVSWLQYHAAGDTPAVVQPWMKPMMSQQYADVGVGEKIPGFKPIEADTGTYSMSGIPELSRPSAQYLSRIGPTAQQQLHGYRQARTGIRPEEQEWRQWQMAPPSGGGINLTYRR